MGNNIPEKLTTPEGVESSIMCDKYVFRWFLYLITRPRIKEMLSGDAGLAEIYRRLKSSTLWQESVGLAVVMSVMAALCSRNYKMLVPAALFTAIFLRLS